MVAFKVKREHLPAHERSLEAREKVLRILEKAFMQRLNRFTPAIEKLKGSFEVVVDARDYRVELKSKNIPADLLEEIMEDMNYLM